jgi:uncharacterized membrane protein (UPF0182 family)
MVGWLQTISVVMLIAVGAASGYTWYIEQVKGTIRPDTRRRATTAVSLALAPFALMLAVSTFLDRFDLLHGQHELFTGMDYTDVTIRLKAMNLIVGLLVISSLLVAANAFFWKRLRTIVTLGVIVAAVWIVGLGILPSTYHSFSVKPNELAKEAAFIEHNIKMTRHAFAIDRLDETPDAKFLSFEEHPFEPKPTLTAEQVQANRETIDNVRLWDRRALQSTLAQIQEIRTYYDFRTPDVDRYMINGRLREVMLSAREMNVDQLPEQSRNWINQHVVYTHGYGVTMNTVKRVYAGGSSKPRAEEHAGGVFGAGDQGYTSGDLFWRRVQFACVRAHKASRSHSAGNSIIRRRETWTHIQPTRPSQGFRLAGLLRQIALSLYLGDGTNLLFSDYIHSDSRVLIRRNVSERVRQIAPFLLFEDDPYVVIGRDGKLYWIIDAFTHAEQYPYSTAYQVGDLTVNYLRNSVKAVVDAYDGSVRFYVFEPNDPIIRAYQEIFPALFQQKSAMPEDLLAHARYSSLMVNTQARVYTLYHMQNTQTFYNHEDLWAIAAGETTQSGEASVMQPYHVLMQLPAEQNGPLEFVNILPFTPSGPGRSNMIGWMAARSDGANYGRTKVLYVPEKRYRERTRAD